jgi:hypothetical protein
VLEMRIGSEGREPRWARWPMNMHRPLPPRSVIKQVTVSSRAYGQRVEWSVELTVTVPEPCGVEREGAFALDVGWRWCPENSAPASGPASSKGEVPRGALRVGVGLGTDGAREEIRISQDEIGGFRKVESLRSLRDRGFDVARAELKEALATATFPEAMARELTTLGQWKSPARLAGFCSRWKKNRFSGDDASYLALEMWRYRDWHLWEWESGQRRRSIRRRREGYRIFAARLASRYRTIVLEKFDLRTMARKSNEEESQENQVARGHRQLAAVSDLRSALKNAFESRGGEVVEVPAHDSTHICHECGVVEVFDAAVSIDHTCSACGAGWDQDDNAAKVLLERWRARPTVKKEDSASAVGVEKTRGSQRFRKKSRKEDVGALANRATGP